MKKILLWIIHFQDTVHRVENQWVFCTLKAGNAVGSFTIAPNEDRRYLLKIYAGPEENQVENAHLDQVANFILVCSKVRFIISIILWAKDSIQIYLLEHGRKCSQLYRGSPLEGVGLDYPLNVCSWWVKFVKKY